MKRRKPVGNRYGRIIEKIFLERYKPGAEKVPFERGDIELTARKLKINVPKNLGDVISSFRFRVDLPESITSRAPKGLSWIIRLVGRSKYAFVAIR